MEKHQETQYIIKHKDSYVNVPHHQSAWFDVSESTEATHFPSRYKATTIINKFKIMCAEIVVIGDDPKLIGSDLINHILTTHNLKQTELGKLLGVTNTHIGNIYNGITYAGNNLITLLQLIKAIPVSVEILKDMRNMNKEIIMGNPKTFSVSELQSLTGLTSIILNDDVIEYLNLEYGLGKQFLSQLKGDLKTVADKLEGK